MKGRILTGEAIECFEKYLCVYKNNSQNNGCNIINIMLYTYITHCCYLLHYITRFGKQQVVFCRKSKLRIKVSEASNL